MEEKVEEGTEEFLIFVMEEKGEEGIEEFLRIFRANRTPHRGDSCPCQGYQAGQRFK